ncbi:MAG: insulinase family protein [Flavobacteriales bacterium]|nr:insulinase family protein [Flavobacteriales bacterium]
MIDRSIVPQINPIDSVQLPPPETRKLDNGIPVHIFDLADQNLIKIEVVFKSGSANQSAELVAEFTANMMSEGTASKTALEIANQVDFYGSFLEHSVSKDFTSFTLYCLTKYVKESLEVFADVLINPSFPENELKIQLRNDLQKFQVNSDKVSVLCRRAFTQRLYDPNHAYYGTISEESFNLNVNSLSDHYNANINFGAAEIFVSGYVKESVLENINALFGAEDVKKPNSTSIDGVFSSLPDNVMIEKEGAMQSAIRIGKLLPFKRGEGDYVPFSMLNTILGGYFSSRLMANIREDKGYTYGIGSGVIANLASTTFLISTEVNGESTQATLDEIYKEIKLLQTNLVSPEELNRVKQYVVGSFLRNSDGPFDVCERFKSTLLFGMDYSYYESYLASVQDTTAEKILEMAQKHLNIDSMLEVVAGIK